MLVVKWSMYSAVNFPWIHQRADRNRVARSCTVSCFIGTLGRRRVRRELNPKGFGPKLLPQLFDGQNSHLRLLAHLGSLSVNRTSCRGGAAGMRSIRWASSRRNPFRHFFCFIFGSSFRSMRIFISHTVN
jgi:hypothetical protein